jgi:hypothetical protein
MDPTLYRMAVIVLMVVPPDGNRDLLEQVIDAENQEAAVWVQAGPSPVFRQ